MAAGTPLVLVRRKIKYFLWHVQKKVLHATHPGSRRGSAILTWLFLPGL